MIKNTVAGAAAARRRVTTLCFTPDALRKQGSSAPKRSENEDVSTSTTSEATDLPCQTPDIETSPETPQQPVDPGLLQRLSNHWVPAAVVTAALVVAVAAVWVTATR
jgi:hypothetical protein